jgi:hypothetical protein
MKTWLRLILALTVFTAVWLLGGALAAQQAAPPAAQGTSDQVFKNVQVLKGIPVDDFMGTMGIMCAALGFDCSDCHTGAGTEKVDWAADTPKKLMARRMVRMMTAINRDNFSGRQMVRPSVSEFELTPARPFTRPVLLHQITEVVERVPE